MQQGLFKQAPPIFKENCAMQQDRRARAERRGASRKARTSARNIISGTAFSTSGFLYPQPGNRSEINYELLGGEMLPPGWRHIARKPGQGVDGFLISFRL